MENLETLFQEHIQLRMKNADKALEAMNYKSMVLGSGEPFTYFEDDSDAVFKPNPHFAHWCPAQSPHHFIKYEPGQKPLLVYYSPDDFWHVSPPLGKPFWLSAFNVVEVKTKDKLWAALGNLNASVFIGNETKYAYAEGMIVNCQIFTARLNWYRRFKSQYEIHCVAEANRIAAIGHKVAKQSFLDGKSEYEIHLDYLKAIQATDAELPYNAIVCLDQNAATLHYQHREHKRNGRVFLIDSGAKFNHYPSDITRTYATPSCSSVFLELLSQTEKMQKDLCQQVKTGLYFPTLHETCHLKIAEILENVGILKLNGDHQMALNEGITKAFFPHGLGHLLGIQVHDIGGKQLDEQGNIAPINKANVNYRSLRFVGLLEDQVLVTIEPGIYFIPTLLHALKEKSKIAHHVNWDLIEKMIPYGGIRIEDNVLTTGTTQRNLTREAGI